MNRPQAPAGIMDMVFVGFNSRVVALDRESGAIVWTWRCPKGSSPHVAVLLDGDRLIASVKGYMYAIDVETGTTLWQNPLPGMGFGIPSLTSLRGNSGSAAAAAMIAQMEQQQQLQQ